MFNIVIKGAGASHYYFSLEDISLGRPRPLHLAPSPLLASPRGFLSVLSLSSRVGLKNPREN